jgi:hypothetical protein
MSLVCHLASLTASWLATGYRTRRDYATDFLGRNENAAPVKGAAFVCE